MWEKESVFQRMYGTFVGLVQIPEILDNCSDTCIERKPQWLAGICDRGNKPAGKLTEAVGLTAAMSQNAQIAIHIREKIHKIKRSGFLSYQILKVEKLHLKLFNPVNGF